MIVEQLLAAGERGGSRPAVSDPFLSLDYGNFIRLASVMRRQVERHTTRPHVGMLLPSGCPFAATFYGILWAGRTAVPLNFLLQPAEIAAVVQDAEVDTVFSIRHFEKIAAELPAKTIFIEDLGLKRAVVVERLRRQPSAPSVSPDDIAVLLYTSGTSGVPKGVCQTYRNLRSDIDGAIRKAELKTDHHFLGLLPLSHSFGLTAMLMVPVALASSAHYLPRFQPAQVIEAIRERRSSVTMMVASMYSALLKTKKGDAGDVASIQYAISGGEGLPDAVHAAFKQRFGIDILQGYGMTEASPVVSLNVPWSNRVGTVGQAIPGVEVAAFDDDGRKLDAVATGALDGDARRGVGELRVRGPIVMRGYYKKPEETAAAITPDGWYLTGDMGKLDADGYISITGRKKEMIIVGGENVYPREIESILEQHPAVLEAAVIGQHDASRGEVVVAFVTLRDGAHGVASAVSADGALNVASAVSAHGDGAHGDGALVTEIELRDFCRERIAGYKAPRRVVVSADLPRGPTGKILKRKLAELL